MVRFDAVVVGAGLAGTTSARLLAESGKKVLLIEKRRHIAGNCYDYKNEYGITVHKYGPHIFHTNNSRVWKFVNRFSKFRYYQHRVLSYVDGKYLPFPINRDTIAELFGVDLPTAEVESFLREEVRRSKFNIPPQNFEDQVISQVGERLYEKFFKGYTIKQWNKDPKELSADIAKRVPIRSSRDGRYFTDKYQGIPVQGYTRMMERILNHENISVLLGVNYFDIKEELKSDLTVYTGKLDEFFGYSFGRLEYRSLRFEFITYDMEYYQPAAVVNYPNDYDWTRITEYKYFLDEKVPKTTVSYEYPVGEGEPYYVVLTKENMMRREKYMKEVKKLERSGEYIFVGRLAEYKYYNMDQVIEKALERLSFNA